MAASTSGDASGDSPRDSSHTSLSSSTSAGSAEYRTATEGQSTPADPQKSLPQIASANTTMGGTSDTKLTPIRSIKEVKPHDRTELTETLRKAQNGETFLPETLNFPSTVFSSPRRKIVFPAASSPKHGRDGISLQFFQSQPGLFNAVTPDGTINPVKGAYNVFDKRTPVAGAGVNSSPRKRKRIATPMSDTKVMNVKTKNPLKVPEREALKSKEPLKQPTTAAASSVPTAVASASLMQKLLTDPQAVTNISLILQVLVNTAVFGSIFALILLCFFGVKRDADYKVQTYVNDLVHKINGCRREYVRNHCSPESRVPALELSCTQWENCMAQDPQSVVSSAAYFEIMAECFNAFFHNLSFRSLASLLVLLVCAMVLPNILFSKFRSNNNPLSTTTTTNNNYYSITHDQSMTDSHSPVRLISHSAPTTPMRLSPQKMIDTAGNTTVFFTPLQGEEDSEAKSSSVRFNPNVSYSLYEYDRSDSPTLRTSRNRDKY